MEKENALEKAFAQIKEAVKAEAETVVAPKEVKAAAKKPAAKKTAPAKEPAEKATPAQKAPAKTTEKKTTSKKTKAVEAKTAVTFEFNGKQLLAKDVLDRAMKAFQETNKDTEIESFELYIVASENAAYYVVNGVGSDEYKISI